MERREDERLTRGIVDRSRLERLRGSCDRA
jgi:hypothetical protein